MASEKPNGVMGQEEVQQVPSIAVALPSAEPPPIVLDSGIQAWLQVVGAFCLYFNTWGVFSMARLIICSY